MKYEQVFFQDSRKFKTVFGCFGVFLVLKIHHVVVVFIPKDVIEFAKLLRYYVQ